MSNFTLSYIKSIINFFEIALEIILIIERETHGNMDTTKSLIINHG